MNNIERRCPECNAVLDYIKYYTEGTEYGTCNIFAEDNWESDGFDSHGDTTFECPECGALIPSFDENKDIKIEPKTAKSINSKLV